MLENFPDPFFAEISGQPAALQRAAEGLRRQIFELRRIPTVGEGRPVIFTGMGGSYAACYASVTSLGEQGTPALMVDSAELLYFRRPALAAAPMLVLVSQSGESAEVVRLAEALDREGKRPFMVSVTNGTRNSVSRLVDVALDSAAGNEQGPSTMTFAAALVVLAAVARLIRGEDAQAAVDGLSREADSTARVVQALLGLADQRAEPLRRWLGDRPILALLGRGAARAASEMGALTLKEAARFPAEAMESAQFRHGPLELAGQDTAVVLISTESAAADVDARLAQELRDAGVAVMRIGSEHIPCEGVQTIALGALDRVLSAAAAIVPIQLLAWRLALDRGFEPGSYTRASKVTTRE